MRTYLTFLLLFCFEATVFGQSKNTLAATFTNIETQNGYLMVQLLNESGEPVQNKRVAVNGEAMEIIFEELDNGNYAIRSFHDEDGNGELNTNFFGIPTEAYGFSNNVRGGMTGPPSLSSQLVELNTNTSVSIKLE